MGQKEMAINYRTRFAYRIDAWDAMFLRTV
jgi:hypothetical protein